MLLSITTTDRDTVTPYDTNEGIFFTKHEYLYCQDELNIMTQNLYVVWGKQVNIELTHS